MRKLFVSMMVVALAIIGVATCQDFVSQVGGTPLIKDMGNLSMEEINAIFSGDGAWINSQYTPSIEAFLKSGAKEGSGLGGKPLLLGSMAKNVRQTQVFFTPIELSAFQARYGNVSPDLILRN